MSEGRVLRQLTIGGYKSGSPDAVRELYQAYAPMVYSTAFRVLRNRAASARATLDCYVQLWRHPEILEPGMDPGPWLAGLARHCALAQLTAEPRGDTLPRAAETAPSVLPATGSGAAEGVGPDGDPPPAPAPKASRRRRRRARRAVAAPPSALGSPTGSGPLANATPPVPSTPPPATGKDEDDADSFDPVDLEAADERTLATWQVRQAMTELLDPDREVMRMHFLLGLSIEETAASLGTTHETVVARLHRGQHRLADRLPDLMLTAEPRP